MATREMQKNFEMLTPWLDSLIMELRREIKKQHLKQDVSFCRKHFGFKPLAQIKADAIVEVYKKGLLAGNEEISHIFQNLWLQQNEEVYHFFFQRLSKVNPEIEAITEFEPEFEAQLKDEATQTFGAFTAYIFSTINSVAFKEETLANMREAALAERAS